MTRRLAFWIGVALMIPQAACLREADPAAGELASAPGAVTPAADAPTGLQHLDARGDRSARLYVPSGYRADRPAALVVMLHGAGRSAADAVAMVEGHAERQNMIVLAPTARAATWDIIAQRRYGPDVEAIDAALAQVFARYTIDPERVAIAGFSDGASYALSLGLANGELFRHILAFSPGFMAPTRDQGRPHVFISHGVNDPVLPVDATSRRIVEQLRSDGYEVDYVEFPDGHSVPPEISDRSFARLSG